MDLIGQAVSEEKIFEIVNYGRRRTTTDDGRRSMGILQAHLRAFGSGELKIDQKVQNVFLPMVLLGIAMATVVG